MNRSASLLILSLSAWGCGTEVATPSSSEVAEVLAKQGVSLSNEELQASLFHPREAILLTLNGDNRSALLMLTDKPGACARFKQGKIAPWEKGITFELGKADGYTEDWAEANALPLDAGFYKVVHHDDTSAGPFQDRWTIVFTAERDGQCNNTSTLGSAQSGGVFLQSLDLGASGGGQGAYYVSFGATASQQRFGAFEATPCHINIEDLPPVFTCE
ncbi:hypothetical protein [Pyxidicoccus trucidator]|uniref:hypothetical protein n=1 Tax=Pyxidicoccus trucidator TaxID=2709662 RepID=UPI0013DC57E9|nr:hypothetical protein [Pyxidicoccus trucidator]